MPKDFLALDTGFPSFTGRETVGQKVDQLYNYTYMLLENLRYCLRNLGPENFNEAALNEITEPIYADIRDAEGNTAQLALTAQALAVRIGDAEGNVSQLQETAAGLTSAVAAANGSISTLQQTAESLTSRVQSAEGSISALQQTSDSLTAAVSSANGDIASLQVTAAGLTTRVGDAEGKVSVVQQTVNGLTVTGADGTTRIKGGLVDAVGLHVQAANIDGPVTAAYVASTAVLSNNIQLNGVLAVYNPYLLGYIGGYSGVTSGVGMFGCNVYDSLLGLYHFACVATSTGAKIACINQAGADIQSIHVTTAGCYSTSAMQVYSDRRLKKDIDYRMERYGSLFDRLRPCWYRLKKEKGGRIRMGLVAQDVLEAAKAGGIGEDELALVGKNGDYYALAYGELIALCVWKIQQLEGRVARLEGRAS